MKYVTVIKREDNKHCPKCGGNDLYLTSDERENFIRCNECRLKIPYIMIVDIEQ